MHNLPIIIVEDDKDDCEFIVNALKNSGVMNEFRCFESPVKALEYLRTTTEIPFIIISDINMPHMSGLTFKRVINDDEKLSAQRIPFVFLSTSASPYIVDEAFHLCAQGYFQKPVAHHSYIDIAKAIISYWTHSKLPQAIGK